MLSKRKARQLQRDFIPDGEPIDDINALEFERTKEDEVFQCCKPTAHDPQSGPIYCGDVAEYIAPVPEQGGVLALCERHRPPERLIHSAVAPTRWAECILSWLNKK